MSLTQRGVVNVKLTNQAEQAGFCTNVTKWKQGRQIGGWYDNYFVIELAKEVLGFDSILLNSHSVTNGS